MGSQAIGKDVAKVAAVADVPSDEEANRTKSTQRKEERQPAPAPRTGGVIPLVRVSPSQREGKSHEEDAGGEEGGTKEGRAVPSHGCSLC